MGFHQKHIGYKFRAEIPGYYRLLDSDTPIQPDLRGSGKGVKSNTHIDLMLKAQKYKPRPQELLSDIMYKKVALELQGVDTSDKKELERARKQYKMNRIYRGTM